MPNERGYLMVAVNSVRYLEMALDAALAVKVHNSEPITLVLDRRLERVLTPKVLSVFDSIVPLPPGYRQPNLFKLCLAEVTPYERTLYLDADFLTLGSLESLWSRLDGHVFSVQGEFHDSGSTHEHHGALVGDRMRAHGLSRYLKSNAGLIYFRKQAAEGIYQRARELLAQGKPLTKPHGFVSDEVLLGILSDTCPISPFPSPLVFPWYPSEWNAEVHLGLHVLGRVPALFWQREMDAMSQRRGRYGLPPNRSRVYWQAKANRRNPWYRYAARFTLVSQNVGSLFSRKRAPERPSA